MFKQDLLKDKVVLITGGGSGIGKEMARKFGSLGAKIAILGRREEVLKETAEELSRENIEIIYHKCDVRNVEEIKTAVDFFYSKYGTINVLVNNAAGNFVSPFEKISKNGIDAILDIVLKGTLYMTWEIGRRWINDHKGGVVLDIVTTYAWTGSAFVIPSAAAKAGVLAVVRSLAVEWAKYGIRHVAIAPGPFPTEATKKNLYPLPGMEERLISRVPLGRAGNMEEISNLAAFLISDGASFINGEVVTIDGGEWLKGAGQFNDLLALTEEQWEQIKAISKRK